MYKNTWLCESTIKCGSNYSESKTTAITNTADLKVLNPVPFITEIHCKIKGMNTVQNCPKIVILDDS